MNYREFVGLIAAIMALNALALDQILPAVPVIGQALLVADPNERQWLISSYFIGLGAGSLLYGSLSDWFGRKPVLLASTGLFLTATLACIVAPTFLLMLVARGAQGVFAAGGRVVTVSIIRDRYSGDRMARIASLIFFCSIIAPAIAPSLGQLTLYVANWRWIFGSLFLAGVAVMAWIAVRLPETIEPQNRVRVRAKDIAVMLREIATNRSAMGYMMATGIVSGALTGFMVSVQQIFADYFHRPGLFPLAFAAMASFMSAGSYFNSRLVLRAGARRLSHCAAVLMIALAASHCLVIVSGFETLASFMCFQVATTLGFAFAVPNFSAISMQPFARGAGLASSFQTCLTTIVSAFLGAAIGANFDGSPLPAGLGFLILGIIGLAFVAWAERWRLFAPPLEAPA